jgi:hypothetical protein
MALNTGKKITRRNWDVIPMPELVIARVNLLGKDQPELFTFTDRHGCLIGDAEEPGIPDDFAYADDVDFPGVDPAINDNIEIPGVDDAEGLQIPAPPEIETNDDLNIPPDPAPFELEPVQEETAQLVAPVMELMQLPEPWRSRRVRTQTTPGYIPSMSGSKYSYAFTQLESHGVLNPDAHMFMQDDFYQADPDVVAMIMTQLSLKAGLKAWGHKAHNAAHNKMKQLHMRDTFKPKHWRELSSIQRQMVLESHMFLKKKRDGKTKARTVAGGTNNEDTFRKRTPAHLPWLQSQSF